MLSVHFKYKDKEKLKVDTGKKIFHGYSGYINIRQKKLQSLCKTVWHFLKMLNIELWHDPELHSWVYWREVTTFVHRNTCTQKFTAALFTMAEVWGGEGWAWMDWARDFLLERQNVLKLHRVDGCTTVNIRKSSGLCTLERLNFRVCEFYLSEVVIKKKNFRKRALPEIKRDIS